MHSFAVHGKLQCFKQIRLLFQTTKVRCRQLGQQWQFRDAFVHQVLFIFVLRQHQHIALVLMFVPTVTCCGFRLMATYKQENRREMKK